MESQPAYGGSIGNNGGIYNNNSPTAQLLNPQGIESKLAQSEPMLTVGDVAAILRVSPEFVRERLDGLPDQIKDVRGDGSYFVRTYCLSDVVLFLEKARGQPLPDGPIEPLLTTNEAAEILHVQPWTVTSWSKKGILHAYQLGPHTFRYDRGKVEALAEKLGINIDLE